MICKSRNSYNKKPSDVLNLGNFSSIKEIWERPRQQVFSQTRQSGLLYIRSCISYFAASARNSFVRNFVIWAFICFEGKEVKHPS